MRHTTNKPAIYVGTYHKYASGSIAGAWIYPGDYDSYEELMDACRALHADEPEGMRELMVQGYENFPSSLYSESYISPALWAYCKAVEEVDDVEALDAYIALFDVDDVEDPEELIDGFNSKFYGYFDSDTDLAHEYIDSTGMLADVPESIANYFDYESFGRDLAYDFYESDGYYFFTA